MRAVFVAVALLMVLFIVSCSGRKDAPPPQVEVPQRKPDEEPGIDEVYAEAINLVEAQLKNPKSSRFSDDGTVQRLRGAKEGQVSWNVSGDLSAVTPAGTQFETTWKAEVAWTKSTNRFAANSIRIGDQTVHESEELKASHRALLYAMGNEVSGLPADIAGKIADVHREVMEFLHWFYPDERAVVPQWPDDPQRQEFKIHVDSKWFWEVTGRVDFRDGGVPRECYAQVERDNHKIVRIRTGSLWLEGGPMKGDTEREHGVKKRQR